MSFVFVSSICVLTWLVWSFLWKNFFATKIKGPWAFPIIGTVSILFDGPENILQNIFKILEKFQPFCKIWLANNLTILIRKPDYVQIVVRKCLEKGDKYRFLKTFYGNGLITTPVSQWKLHRKTIEAVFSQKILNDFMETHNLYSRKLVEKLKNQKSELIDIFPVMSHCALDIICNTIMGVKSEVLDEENFFYSWINRLAELTATRVFNPFLYPDLLWKLSSNGKESLEINHKIHNYIKSIIENKRRDQTYLDKKIFLDYLIELTDENSWTDDELIDETRTVIIAGSDATALTLSYCLIMLAMHPKIQEKVYGELRSVFGDSDRFATTEDLSKLPYLDRFIKETLRLIPIGSFIARKLTSDLTLDQYFISKGTNIAIPIISIHRNPEIYPEPLKFDPDRFLPEEVVKREPCTYLPFSFGPRNCLGIRFAMMAMKVILATIIRNFQITKTPYKTVSDIKLKFDIATKCVDGYFIQLKSRK